MDKLPTLARYTAPINPREKQASEQLDPTATTVLTGSANQHFEEATVLLANVDSADASYSLYVRDTTGTAADIGNAVVKDAYIPQGAHAKVDVEGFGGDQLLEGTSSSNSVVATVIARELNWN